jgi:hypothetical protein
MSGKILELALLYLACWRRTTVYCEVFNVAVQCCCNTSSSTNVNWSFGKTLHTNVSSKKMNKKSKNERFPHFLRAILCVRIYIIIFTYFILWDWIIYLYCIYLFHTQSLNSVCITVPIWRFPRCVKMCELFIRILCGGMESDDEQAFDDVCWERSHGSNYTPRQISVYQCCAWFDISHDEVGNKSEW